MSLRIPSFFKVKTATDRRTPIPLNHQVVTTTDFFRLQPVICREMVPHDKFNCNVESFARFTPMPFPTIGRIKFQNRAFFVPYRQIFEGFNDFIEETSEVMVNGLVYKDKVPKTNNLQLAHLFYNNPANRTILQGLSYRTFDVDGSTYLTSLDGRILLFQLQDSSGMLFCVVGIDKNPTPMYGEVWTRIYRSLPSWMNTSNSVVAGTFQQNVSSFDFVFTGSFLTHLQTYFPSVAGGVIGLWLPASSAATLGTGYLYALIGSSSATQTKDYPLLVSQLYDTTEITYDFVVGTNFCRFTRQGRQIYNLLLSLGYRVDFSHNGEDFSNQDEFSVGKILAYLRVYLDYYSDSNSEQVKHLYKYFKQWSFFAAPELSEILSFSTVMYERDYFTAAWDNPASPNQYSTAGRSYSIPDQLSSNNPIFSSPARVGTSSLEGQEGSLSRPTLWMNTPGPSTFSQYLIDALKDLQMYMHRHQLAGFRTVDRYLAEFGVKLSDDRSGRCYYLGSNDFSAQIGDVMSNSETAEAKLGDYAGKAVAYGQSRKFDFETEEYGYFIIVSSCVPTVGYVQGVDRENLHLTPFDFHRAQFDNLGTQAIENRELFGDYGMAGVDGNGVVSRPQGFESDGVFGFIPRYAEYKVGRDFLTGDFAIPSRRRGMDAFHLFRLFSGREDINLTRAFRTGEQEQFDRVFNNQDSDYDHIYLTHSVEIQALRPMKSISETIDWDDDLGREVEIPTNGTQMN